MKDYLIRAFNQLNQDFYAQISEDFSESRNFFWSGWEKVLEILPKKQGLKVLDIACGNGRFSQFLEKNLNGSFNYLGLDNSKELLEIARNKYKKQQFQYFDLVNNYLENKKIILETKEKFDLIAIFGLSHHLASFKIRKALLQSVKNNLSEKGLIIISNWQFAKEQDRFAKNTLNLKKILQNGKINIWQKIKLFFLSINLERNDFLLDWRKGDKANQVFRYCHQINEEEMTKIAKESDLKIVDSFFADGKSNRLNQYFVLAAL
jgi:SAM-dependent methyltransferase